MLTLWSPSLSNGSLGIRLPIAWASLRRVKKVRFICNTLCHFVRAPVLVRWRKSVASHTLKLLQLIMVSMPTVWKRKLVRRVLGSSVNVPLSESPRPTGLGLESMLLLVSLIKYLTMYSFNTTATYVKLLRIICLPLSLVIRKRFATGYGENQVLVNLVRLG